MTVPVTKMNFGRYGYCMYVPEVCVPKEPSRNFTSSRPGSTMDGEQFVPADWKRCPSNTLYVLILTVELCYVNSSEVDYSCMYIWLHLEYFMGYVRTYVSQQGLLVIDRDAT